MRRHRKTVQLNLEVTLAERMAIKEIARRENLSLPRLVVSRVLGQEDLAMEPLSGSLELEVPELDDLVEEVDPKPAENPNGSWQEIQMNGKVVKVCASCYTWEGVPGVFCRVCKELNRTTTQP